MRHSHKEAAASLEAEKQSSGNAYEFSSPEDSCSTFCAGDPGDHFESSVVPFTNICVGFQGDQEEQHCPDGMDCGCYLLLADLLQNLGPGVLRHDHNQATHGSDGIVNYERARRAVKILTGRVDLRPLEQIRDKGCWLHPAFAAINAQLAISLIAEIA